MKNFFFNLWIFFIFFLKTSLSSDFAYITNQLSNSVSVIDLETYKVIKEIVLLNYLKYEIIENSSMNIFNKGGH